MSSPIRVGFIGLSAAATAWANNAHFPYLNKSSDYTITALCNSSIKAAKASIKAHGLPSNTHVYDNAEKLVADPDVDLVVVSVRVDRHYEMTMPALLGGKDIFVEWPLGSNLTQAEELVKLAKQKKVKTVIGLQGEMSPIVHKIKDTIDSGKLGKVLSVSVLGAATNFGLIEPVRISYMLDKDIGGNMLTIHAMHVLDLVLFATGELESFTPLMTVQRPTITLVNPDDSIAQENVKKNTHDQIMLTGRYASGAVLSFHMRGGKPFKDGPGLVWRIYGEKGELSIEGPSALIQVSYPVTVKFHDFEKDEVVEVKEEEQGKEWEEMPMMGRNIGRVYEAFAKGKGYPNWDVALKRHQMIDEMYKRNTA